ncbi:MAG: aspartate-semialdehyde dehydrogenase [Planctomycetes bacterium]|nr:aspartate-semialdehyde dehydrogenase [Planctomycetota bacterium]
MQEYTVAVVGIGMVGGEMLRVLRERNFPAKETRVLATRARKEIVHGHEYDVIPASLEAFDGVDFAFFAGTEGSKGASQQYGWAAVERGCIVIDNGDDFRMDDRVPLVAPEVNPEHLERHQGFIANPNCSTIQMVVALAPLHRKAGIKRIVVSTYQAVSGTGRAAVAELEHQVEDYAADRKLRHEVYPHQIAFNCIPQVSSLKDQFPGYYGEEIKMIREPRKMFDLPDLAVSATCVRVPVFNSHSEAINVQFEEKMTAETATEILTDAPGVRVVDDPGSSVYPLALDASGNDDVLVGRIRQDTSAENCIDLWCVADNIRKGAALNAVQIAEKLIEMGLVKK